MRLTPKIVAQEARQKLAGALRPVISDAQFLIGQGLMVVATVAGVYLAAHEGFRKALEFETVKGELDGYNLRAALRAEMIGNLAALHDLIGHVRETGAFPATAAEWPRIRTDIWMAARMHPALFETPAPVLSSLGAFYAGAPDLIARAQENRILPQVFWDRIKAHMRRLQSETLPMMDASLKASQAVAAEYDYAVLPLDPAPGWRHPIGIDPPQ